MGLQEEREKGSPDKAEMIVTHAAWAAPLLLCAAGGCALGMLLLHLPFLLLRPSQTTRFCGFKGPFPAGRSMCVHIYSMSESERLCEFWLPQRRKGIIISRTEADLIPSGFSWSVVQCAWLIASKQSRIQGVSDVKNS